MPESQVVAVSRLDADGWRAYRAIRLAMLHESPSAFGSTHEEAASFDEALWKQRLTDNVVLLARVGRKPAGSAVFSEYGVTDPGDCSLFGMWVDPAFRRTGVARALVDAVVAQARADGKRRVVLHVVGDNAAAKALYEREGFVATGHSVPYPHDHQLSEIEMCLVIDNRSD
ncbi:MAG: GNAT family N-acetyltransferase [Phycicoccus sp.]|nr:GNAT family N-acetyltransferase [Phycicoccus sp.]NMM34800.1 GNAT family N-acetyltransferase [Phycicoccus sp.]